MKTRSNKVLSALTLLSAFGLSMAIAEIVNVHFERAVDLMEHGSNLITFQSTIHFTNAGNEK